MGFYPPPSAPGQLHSTFGGGREAGKWRHLHPTHLATDQRGEGGWQLPAAPGQEGFGFVPVQLHMAGAGCCLLLSAKCCTPPAKRLRLGAQPGGYKLSGF